MSLVQVGAFKDALWSTDKSLDLFKTLKYGLLNKAFLKERQYIFPFKFVHFSVFSYIGSSFLKKINAV